MWVLLTSQEAAQRLGDGTDYQSLIGDGAVDWIANSSDGSLATASILREDTAASFAVRPARLTRSLDGGATPLTNGDYHAYVLIADADAAVPPDTALARRVEGRIRIEGLEDAGAIGLETAVVEMVPGQLSLSVPGDTATVALRPHSGGTEIDLLSFFASVDSSFFSVVDQDPSQPGIQPFRMNSLLNGLVLRDTLLVGVDSLNAGKYLLDLVYFDQGNTDLLNGDLTLAEFQIVSRDTVGSSRVTIDHSRQSPIGFLSRWGSRYPDSPADGRGGADAAERRGARTHFPAGTQRGGWPRYVSTSRSQQLCVHRGLALFRRQRFG